MNQGTNYKKKVGKIGGIFLGIVLVLTFFSKTLINLALPSVRVEIPKEMSLNNTYQCQSNVSFQKEVPIYAPFESKILEVYVQVGDCVKTGDKLYKLDIEDIEKAFQEKQIALKKAQLNLELLTQQVASINEKTNKIVSKIEKEKIKNYGVAEEKSLEIEDARKQVEINEQLVKENLLAESELRQSKINLEKLIEAQENEEQEKIETKQDAIDSLEEDISSLKEEKDTLQGQIALQELEIEEITLQINELVKKKQGGGIVVASNEGIILEDEEVKFIEEGECITSNQLLMRLGLLKEGYQVEVEVDSTMDFIKRGDKVDLKLRSGEVVEGKVNKLKAEKDKLKLQVVFNGAEIDRGEEVELTFKSEEVMYNNVISYSALYKDSTSYFVYAVDEVNDALGKAYIVKKKKVYIEDYNDEYAAISDGVNRLDKIVVTSEKEIKEGTRVQLENENEVLKDDE